MFSSSLKKLCLLLNQHKLFKTTGVLSHCNARRQLVPILMFASSITVKDNKVKPENGSILQNDTQRRKKYFLKEIKLFRPSPSKLNHPLFFVTVFFFQSLSHFCTLRPKITEHIQQISCVFNCFCCHNYFSLLITSYSFK